MLYYRDSFNYHLNLRMVRRWRAHLLRTELDIKLAGTIFGEAEKDLRRHGELMCQDRGSYLEMQNVLNRNTDGPDNPLSQVFSKASAQQMFWQFNNVKTEVMFWNPNWLPCIGKLLSRSIESWLASHWGWHLWLFAQKGHSEFAPAKEVPRPEEFRRQRGRFYRRTEQNQIFVGKLNDLQQTPAAGDGIKFTAK
jgi:hypothetical protein